MELLNLLIDLLEVKEKKMSAIYSQRFEDGAILRDQERILERMVYEKIRGRDKNWEVFDYKSYDVAISEYLLDKYGIEYSSRDVKSRKSLKVLIREIKLKELGIQ